MTLAWICYEKYHTDWGRDRETVISTPVILFHEPDPKLYERVTPIVYAVIQK